MDGQMTLAEVADKIGIVGRMYHDDWHHAAIAMAATVRAATELLERCATYIKTESGGRCFEDGMTNCPGCIILADIREIRGESK